jgi:hypothetical protein
LLGSEIFPGILARGIAGLERVELFRRELGAEVEFVTVMWFASWEAEGLRRRGPRGGRGARERPRGARPLRRSLPALRGARRRTTPTGLSDEPWNSLGRSVPSRHPVWSTN